MSEGSAIGSAGNAPAPMVPAPANAPARGAGAVNGINIQAGNNAPPPPSVRQNAGGGGRPNANPAQANARAHPLPQPLGQGQANANPRNVLETPAHRLGRLMNAATPLQPTQNQAPPTAPNVQANENPRNVLETAGHRMGRLMNAAPSPQPMQNPAPPTAPNVQGNNNDSALNPLLARDDVGAAETFGTGQNAMRFSVDSATHESRDWGFTRVNSTEIEGLSAEEMRDLHRDNAPAPTHDFGMPVRQSQAAELKNQQRAEMDLYRRENDSLGVESSGRGGFMSMMAAIGSWLMFWK